MSGNNLFNFSSLQRPGLESKDDSQVHLENLHNLGLLPKRAVNESKRDQRGLSDAILSNTSSLRIIEQSPLFTIAIVSKLHCLCVALPYEATILNFC